MKGMTSCSLTLAILPSSRRIKFGASPNIYKKFQFLAYFARYKVKYISPLLFETFLNCLFISDIPNNPVIVNRLTELLADSERIIVDVKGSDSDKVQIVIPDIMKKLRNEGLLN